MKTSRKRDTAVDQQNKALAASRDPKIKLNIPNWRAVKEMNRRRQRIQMEAKHNRHRRARQNAQHSGVILAPVRKAPPPSASMLRKFREVHAGRHTPKPTGFRAPKPRANSWSGYGAAKRKKREALARAARARAEEASRREARAKALEEEASRRAARAKALKEEAPMREAITQMKKLKAAEEAKARAEAKAQAEAKAREEAKARAEAKAQAEAKAREEAKAAVGDEVKIDGKGGFVGPVEPKKKKKKKKKKKNLMSLLKK